MLGAGWLNIGSLVFGVIAWVFPVVILAQSNKANARNRVVFCTAASLGACAIALWMQMLYTDHLVKIEDWSALMDTSSAVALVAGLLLTVTIVLNAIALVVYRGK
jgi:cytochrome c oxidase subunit 4